MIELYFEYLPVPCIQLCFYHVKYAFQNESTFYRHLNIKKLLAQNRRNI